MHLRRIACFVLGAWIFGSLFLGYISLENADTADRLLGAPPPDLNRMVQKLGLENVRTILSYQGAEASWLYSDVWERIQIGFGLLLIVLLLFATRISRIALALCAVMIVFATFAHLVLRPEIDYLGRGLDFAPAYASGHRRLSALRTAYTALEILKIGVGCGLAGYLFVFKTRHARPAPDVQEPAFDRAES